MALKNGDRVAEVGDYLKYTQDSEFVIIKVTTRYNADNPKNFKLHGKVIDSNMNAYTRNSEHTNWWPGGFEPYSKSVSGLEWLDGLIDESKFKQGELVVHNGDEFVLMLVVDKKASRGTFAGVCVKSSHPNIKVGEYYPEIPESNYILVNGTLQFKLKANV